MTDDKEKKEVQKEETKAEPEVEATETPADNEEAGKQTSEASTVETADTPDEESGVSKYNIFIRGLGPNATDETLQNMCKQFGGIASVKAIIDRPTNRCKGYGFVQFKTQEAAKEALTQLKNEGHAVSYARASLGENRSREETNTNLYFANLPSYCTSDMIEELLKPFGKVVSTRVLVDDRGYSRGIGFARMQSKEICEEIIQKMNGQRMFNSTEPIQCRFAENNSRKRKPRMPMGGPMMRPPMGMPYPGYPPMMDPAMAGAPNAAAAAQYGMHGMPMQWAGPPRGMPGGIPPGAGAPAGYATMPGYAPQMVRGQVQQHSGGQGGQGGYSGAIKMQQGNSSME
eukprot:Clim_evm36s156 gene=Clim_evmTU36s156